MNWHGYGMDIDKEVLRYTDIEDRDRDIDTDDIDIYYSIRKIEKSCHLPHYGQTLRISC